MSSQTDLDQGGTFRPRQNFALGPSIGAVSAPEAILRITAGGVSTVRLGTTLITVRGTPVTTVTIQLPAFKGTTSAAQGAVPGPFVPLQVTIIDETGNAGTTNIVILPAAGETISGGSSATINTDYGTLVLQPDPINGGSAIVS